MTCIALGATLDPVRQLFGGGAIGGLTDSQLLERFLARRDEAAFAALVARHGPLVLSACRAALSEPSDVEDAFQAVFLTLVRRARSIRDREALGAWLHRVSRRVAVRASRDGRRRRHHEREALAMSPCTTPTHDADSRDRAAALHEAIDRLPDRLRQPLIVCDLEGVGHEEAARRLGLSVRTLQRRLAEARDRLRARLTRRGLAIAGPALAALLAREASAAVPEALLVATTRSALGLAVGGASATAALPARAIAWSQAGAIGVGPGRLALVGTLALAAWAAAWVAANSDGNDGRRPASNAAPASDESGPKAVSGRLIDGQGRPIVGAGVRFEPDSTTEPPRTGETDADGRFAMAVGKSDAPPKPRDDDPAPQTVVAGRVLDAEGQPVAGATVRFDANAAMAEPPENPPTDTTDDNGLFTLQAPAAAFQGYVAGVAKVQPRIVATADGHTLGWAEIPPDRDGFRPLVEVRLGREDVPIEGRLIDLEGRPVAGATVSVQTVWVAPDGDIEDWVAHRARIDQGPGQRLLYIPFRAMPKTDADGRFRLDGVGAGRVVEMYASGPGIQTTQIYAITREGEPITIESNSRVHTLTQTYQPARFELAVAPSRPLVGTIRDAETGRGVPGVRLRGMPFEESSHVWAPHVEAVSDADGRYRLEGLGVASRYRIFTAPEGDNPYPTGMFEPETTAPSTEPAPIDLTLRRGVLVRGRLLDAETGEPTQGYVQSYAFADDPHVEDYPAQRQGYAAFALAGPDGSFAIPAIPGRNLLGARSDFHRYLPATGYESIAGLDPKLQSFRTVPQDCMPSNFQALVELDIEPGVEEVTRDLTLVPARSLRGTIVDEDGRPLEGGQASGLNAMGWHAGRRALDSAEFEALLPHEPMRRQLVFWHPGRKLAGGVMIEGDEDEPLTVTLHPWGTVTGRVVDDEGRPRKGLTLHLVGKSANGEGFGRFPGYDETLPTGDDGRFRVEGLVPGLKYSAGAMEAGTIYHGDLFSDITPEPGEGRDLGDVTIKPYQPPR